jgi:hypothetical protein
MVFLLNPGDRALVLEQGLGLSLRKSECVQLRKNHMVYRPEDGALLIAQLRYHY